MFSLWDAFANIGYWPSLKMNEQPEQKKMVLSNKSELSSKVCRVDEPKRERQRDSVGKRETDRQIAGV